MATEHDQQPTLGQAPAAHAGNEGGQPAPAGVGLQTVVAASEQLREAGARLAEHNAALTEWAAYLGGLGDELAAAEARNRDLHTQLAAVSDRLDALERGLAAEREARQAAGSAAETLSGLAQRVGELEALRAGLGRATTSLASLLASSEA